MLLDYLIVDADAPYMDPDVQPPIDNLDPGGTVC